MRDHRVRHRTTFAKRKPILVRKNAQLVESWVWPDTVEAFVRSRMRGRVLNVCAGLSGIGDVRLDLDPKQARVIKGEMKHLDFADESFDAVICDPP